MADYAYQLPRGTSPPPPSALRIGLDWQRFHTPPVAGGLADQPLHLTNQIRLALAVYESIQAWRSAETHLSTDGFSKFCSAHPDLVTFMADIWELQEEEESDQ